MAPRHRITPPGAGPDGNAPGPAPVHENECTAYRRAYREAYGVLTARICCCARIRAEHETP